MDFVIVSSLTRIAAEWTLKVEIFLLKKNWLNEYLISIHSGNEVIQTLLVVCDTPAE